MTHLDPGFVAEQKEKLMAEKARLEAEVKEINDGEFVEMGDDEDSNAAEVYTYEQNLGIERDLNQILEKINQSLAAIESGSYGTCEKGDPIEMERLKVLPWATTCIKHAE